MSSTLPVSQPATTPAPTPAQTEAQSLVSSSAATFTSLCNLRDPDQFKSVSVHGFPGEKSADYMDAMVDAIAEGLENQCGIPLQRIRRVTHERHVFQHAKLDDRVLVDMRHVSNPDTPRVTVFYERKAGADTPRKDLA
ncbi:hypothetical protein [Bordetella sp. LUAb4]|uniref:hypothetical protein n=1 Tax=Bordetella sp. LUAb4 TaxID=2843195 RepID=UPI001E3F37A3|nr:hypothetical protein [Bordetella sp. LUAb4]